jgi:HPt (histidine-containing phosphotransfer) domain-containing protein
MEENTYRLEASCKQLEMVCTNLQNEKEMTEKELDEAKENVEFLCKRVKDLEIEMVILFSYSHLIFNVCC